MDKQTRLLTFTFRLTKAERRAIDKLARLHGDKTAAEYVRRVALPNGSPQSVIVRPGCKEAAATPATASPDWKE